MVPMEQMATSPSGYSPYVPAPPPPSQISAQLGGSVGGQNYFPKVDITVVGNKTSSYNSVCYFLTICLASIIIIPLCFMCCMWYKKIIYPKYEVNIEFYRAIGRFLRNNTVTSLTLNVCDNAFNANKARALYESLEGTPLQQFTFSNMALACNYEDSEADDFVMNMSAIKNLGKTTTMTWGDMTL